METNKIIECRSIIVLPPSKRRELSIVMASDDDGQRYDEFMSFLEKDFATLDGKNRAYIIAEIEDVIEGFVRLWYSPYISEWVIDGIVVSPSHRRRGIGYSLLLSALGLASKSGAPSVIVHVRKDNTSAVALYEKIGFQRETMDYLNSYGERRQGWGWQLRVMLPLEDVNREPARQ